MKFILSLLIVVSITVSCQKEQVDPNKNTCGVESPTTDLDWLKQEIARREQDTTDAKKYFYIEQATYNGHTVFIYSNCCSFCLSILEVYDCGGVAIQNADPQKIKNTKVIWSPADFACQLM